MKKALMIASILFIAVVSTACINNIAVQELNNKAAEYMEKGDYEAAVDRLQASLDLDATMYETYYNLGIAAINAKKYETAIEALEGGIKIKPDYADFYYSLGLAQSDLAEMLMEPSDDDNNDDNSEVDKNNASKQNETISNEDKNKAIDLKKASIDNLKKYLEMTPNTEDKENIETLISQNEAFINDNNSLITEKE